MTAVQRVAGVDVVALVLTPAELLVTMKAVQRQVRLQHRQNGCAPATLSAALERLTLVACGPDIHSDTPNRSSQRVPLGQPGRPDVVAPAPVAASSSSGQDGSMQLTANEVAAHMGVSGRQVRRWIRMGLLDAAVTDHRGTYAIDPANVTVLERQRSTTRSTR